VVTRKTKREKTFGKNDDFCVGFQKVVMCTKLHSICVLSKTFAKTFTSTATAIIFVAPPLPAEQPRFDRWRPPRSGLCACANTARRRRRRRRSTFLSIMFGKEMPNKNLSLYQTVFVQTGDERGRGKKNDQSGRDARVVHADFFISQRGRGGGCHRRWWWWWWWWW